VALERPARPDAEARDALRARLVARIPAWYSPAAHLAVPSLFGLAIIAVAIVLIDGLRPWELLTIPVVYVLSNATEWRVHRDLLHRRHPLAKVLYDRHTPEHHMVYVTDDMAMRSPREFRLVLIPAYGIMLIFLGNLPVAAGLWALGWPNVGALFAATGMAYAVSYEWLHLCYHLPADSWLGRRRLIVALRRHHAVHHDPALMQTWNLNVTVPLWDWVRGTIHRIRV
jgi:hypothetical protein